MVKTTTASALSAMLIVGLCAAVCLLPGGTDAKRHGPLLVEDEGARRNRPAGKFYKTLNCVDFTEGFLSVFVFENLGFAEPT